VGAWQTALFDKLSPGTILVDADGGIIAMNDPAERLLASADGLELEGGALVSSFHGDRAGLAAAIAAATAGQGGSELLVRRPSGLRAYSVFVTPLPRAQAVNGSFVRVAAILIGDPDGDLEPHARATARLYGLSPMETAVAIAIVRGASRPEVAASLEISPHTVKTHLGHIFDKTGTGSQVELARLLGSSSILRNGAGE
jgi:DNA-binding CsgD family transcriptional regulator